MVNHGLQSPTINTAQSRTSMIDTAEYPKTYRPSLPVRLFGALAGIFFCGAGAVLAAGTGFSAFSYLLGGALVLAGMFIAAVALMARTTLYEDRISQAGVFGTKELRREDISGYRAQQINGTTYIELLPYSAQLKKISVGKSLSKDGGLAGWLTKIPNLDELDQRAVDRETEQDASLGATPELRKARVQKLKKFAQYLSLGYVLLTVVVAVFPDPGWLALTVILAGPWIAVALVLWSKENFTFVESDKKIALRKGNLLQLLVSPMVPIFILLTTEKGDTFRFPLDWHPLLLPALAGGAAMTALIWLVQRSGKANFTLLLTMCVPMIVYAGGATALFNSAFDRHDARSFAVTVVKKYRTTGKGAADFFTLASDDPAYTGRLSVKAPYGLYAATDIGGTVCAQIHPGFFDMSWETISGCK